jgi:hypothetical protein
MKRVESDMLAALAIVVTTLAQAAGQTAPDAGSLAGCISDASGQRLPGVTILAQLPGVRRTTEADTTGCYGLKDLGPGSYRVIARLRGFTPVTRNRVIVTPRTATRLEWVMQVSGICECVKIAGTLSERVTYAGAVFHVRIAEPDLTQTQPGGFYRQSAQTYPFFRTCLVPPTPTRWGRSWWCFSIRRMSHSRSSTTTPA